MSDSRTRLSGALLALVSALSFSTLGVFASKLYDAGFTVPQTLAWRFTLAAAALLATVGLRRALRRKQARAAAAPVPAVSAAGIAKVALLGLLGFSPQAGLYLLGVRLLAPAMSNLLLYLYPAFVLALSYFFLGRKVSRMQLAALGTSLAGCALTFFERGRYPAIGLAIGVFVALYYAGYLIVAEKILSGFDSVLSSAIIMSVAAVVFWMWAAAAGTPPKLPGSAGAWILAAGIAFISTYVPITCLFTAIRRIGAAETSLFSMIEPLSTVALSMAITGERLPPLRLAGGALIVAGVAMLGFIGREDTEGRAAAIPAPHARPAGTPVAPAEQLPLRRIRRGRPTAPHNRAK